MPTVCSVPPRGPRSKSYQQANGLTANGVVDASVAHDSPSAEPPRLLRRLPRPRRRLGSAYVGLTVGSQGSQVKDLQRALMNTGLTLLGGADGVFGNATKSFLILFQRVNGLTQNGVVSEKVATLLSLGSPAAPQGIGGQSGYAVYGERGARVTALQRSLMNVGISFVGGADGVFGGSTAGAILAFQRREGLPVTGKVDAATANRLRRRGRSSAGDPVDSRRQHRRLPRAGTVLVR